MWSNDWKQKSMILMTTMNVNSLEFGAFSVLYLGHTCTVTKRLKLKSLDFRWKKAHGKFTTKFEEIP